MDNKIILQNASGAFLINGDNYLLIKRSPKRKIAPNLWSCVGGLMDENEINDPLKACVREIWEETGISKENIFNLKLRYIIIRRYKDIVRQNYIYFGETNVKEFIDTEEGTLHWINEKDLLEKEYTKVYAEMIKHYIQNKNIYQNNIILGVAGKKSDRLKMNWSVLEDFE